MKSPQPQQQSRDIFGAEFSGTPSHNRVLKPPGGGSSDIFGTSSAANGTQGQEQAGVEGTPAGARRANKNHQTSHLAFGGVGDESSSASSLSTPARSHGKDTYSRLFGPAPPPPSTPVSSKAERMRSRIGDVLSQDEVMMTPGMNGRQNGKSSSNGLNGSVTPASSVSSLSPRARSPETNGVETNGNVTNGHSETDSNGGGGAPQMNGGGKTNGHAAAANPPAPTAPLRNRVPPGGYSSGLW